MSNILEDLIVNIRFNTDQSGANKAIDATKTVAKNLVKGALAVAAAVVVGQKTATKWAKSLNSIWIQSKRAGVSNITVFKAIDSAAQKAGTSADGLRSSMTNMADFLFKYGAAGLSLMQSTLSADIKAGDAQEVIIDKAINNIRRLKKEHKWNDNAQGNFSQAASEFGISMDTQRMMVDDKASAVYQKSLIEHTAALKGAPDKQQPIANELNDKANTLDETTMAAFNKVTIAGAEGVLVAMNKEIEVVEASSGKLDEMAGWIDKLNIKLQELLNGGLKAFAENNPLLTGALAASALALTGGFTALVAGIGGIGTAIGGVLTLATGVATYSAGKYVMGKLDGTMVGNFRDSLSDAMFSTLDKITNGGISGTKGLKTLEAENEANDEKLKHLGKHHKKMAYATSKADENAIKKTEEKGKVIGKVWDATYGAILNSAKDKLKEFGEGISKELGSTTSTASNTTASGAIDTSSVGNSTGGAFAKKRWSKNAGNVPQIIEEVSKEQGLDPVFMKAMAMIESGGDPKAYNKSSASGVYQFIRSTGKRYGLNDSNKFDAKTNINAGAQFTKDNIKDLKKRGIETSPANLYLAHQQGVAGLSALLKAAKSGQDPREIILDKKRGTTLRTNMDANGGKGKTAKEFVAYWTNSVNALYNRVKGGASKETNNKPEKVNKTLERPANIEKKAFTKTIVKPTSIDESVNRHGGGNEVTSNGSNLTQNITINGATDPNKVSDMVVEKTKNSNLNAARNGTAGQI